MKKAICLILTLLMLLTCASFAEEAAAPAEFPTSQWKLSGGEWWDMIGQPGMKEYYEAADVTLFLDSLNGTVVITVNNAATDESFILNGTYTSDASTINVNAKTYGLTLEAVFGYTIEGDTLTITGETGSATFTKEFCPIISSEWLLTGGDWWNVTGQSEEDYAGCRVCLMFTDLIDDHGILNYSEKAEGSSGYRVTKTLRFTVDQAVLSLENDMIFTYEIYGDTLTLTGEAGTGLFTRYDPKAEEEPAEEPVIEEPAAEEPAVSTIPTSSWIFTGEDWSAIIGQPSSKDYYNERSIIVSFDAEAGTIIYSEADPATGDVTFTGDGTYTDNGSVLDVKVKIRSGEMAFSIGYVMDGDTITIDSGLATGTFTRAE